MQVVVFTGGGTGGHVFPGVALVQALRERADFRLVWIGSESGIERSVIEGLGWEYRSIATGKLRRYFSWKNLTDLVRIVRGYGQARRILKELRPVFVFSKGGFVSVPPVRAARSLKIPVYSHESDLDAGLATRLNLTASRRLFVAYDHTRSTLAPGVQSRVVVSGNPVRREFFTEAPTPLRDLFRVPPGAPVVLVLGGSLGALQVNTLLAQALPQLSGRVFVVHQTGSSWTALPDTEWYVSRPFFSTEMPALEQGASTIFGRAGAGTLWEAAACRVPLVLLPLGKGSRGDQVRNAQHFARRGAAVVLTDSSSPEDLVTAVLGLCREGDLRSSQQEALGAFGARDAADRIVAEVLALHPEVKRV